MEVQENFSIRDLILNTETHVDFYHDVRQGVTSRREAIDELEILVEEIEDDFRKAVAMDLLGKREEAKNLLGNSLCSTVLSFYSTA